MRPRRPGASIVRSDVGAKPRQSRDKASQQKQGNRIRSDDVLDWEKHPEKAFLPEEFHWLAIALYRAAGLDAHTVLLPNREFTRFNPDLVSRVFCLISRRRCGSRTSGNLRLRKTPLPSLRPATLATRRRRRTARVGAATGVRPNTLHPPRPVGDRLLRRADPRCRGNIDGDCRRTFTGQTAATLRRLLRQADTPHQQASPEASSASIPKSWKSP